MAIQTQSQSQENNYEIVYVMDPMCSWCYGISPEMDQLKAKYDTVPNFSFKVIAGGLRPGNKEAMDDNMESFLTHHWVQINKRTGQPFSYEILKDKSFIYDTEPVDKALVIMREMNEVQTYNFVKATQTAFYAENKDITNYNILADIAAKFNIDRSVFLKKLESEEYKAKTWNDFRYAHSLGATGFPSVYLKYQNEYTPITIGYTEFKQLDKNIQKAIKKN